MKKHERVLDFFNKFDGSRAVRHVKATTALQEATFAVKKAKQKSEEEFNTALGRLFVLSSDAFKQRNGFYNHLVKALHYIRDLEKEINHYRAGAGLSPRKPYIDPEAKIDPKDHKTIITKV